jgi:hypothetical protein
MKSAIGALVNQGDKSQSSAFLSLRSKRARRASVALLVCALILLLPPPARSTMTLNSAGAGGAPLTVGTSAAVQVLAADGGRSNWSIEAESGDIRCSFGDSLGNPPSPEPTATVGFLIPYVKGQLWRESGTTNARLRLDCIAVSSSTAVDTAEEKP